MSWLDNPYSGTSDEAAPPPGAPTAPKKTSWLDLPYGQSEPTETPRLPTPPRPQPQAAAAQFQGFRNPFGAPAQPEAVPEPLPQARTPISEASQRLPSEIANIPIVGGLASAGLAIGQNVGDALAQFGAPTQGTENTAAPVENLLKGVPGVNIAATALESVSPEFREAAQTPLRDVPVLGGITRGVETATSAFNAGWNVASQPALGLRATVGQEFTQADNPIEIGRNAALRATNPLANLLLFERTPTPEVYGQIGSTPREMGQLFTGWLTGANSPDANRRFEELAQRAGQVEQEENPVSSVVVGSLFDPLTYLDVAAVIPKIGKMQQLRRVWQAAGDVTQAGVTVSKASPLEQILFRVLSPKSIGKGELLTEAALKIPGPEASQVGRRIVQPFAKTPTAMVTETITRIDGALRPFLTDGGRDFGGKVKFIEAMKQSLKSNAVVPALQEFFGKGIANSQDVQRAVRAIGDFDPAPTVQQYTKARAVWQSLADAQSTTRPAFNEMEAGFVKASAQELGQSYQTVFDRVLDGWKSGKLDLQEAERAIENLAGLQLSNDLTEHMAGTLASKAKIPVPNVVTRLMNTFRAYEGLVYVGGSPATIATNLVNNISTLARYGVTPQDLGAFWKRIGYQPPSNIGELVSKAAKGAYQNPNLPFGAELPERLRNAPGLKQLGEAWQRSEKYSREQAWATGFERFMSANFAPPALPDVIANYIRDTQGAKGLDRVMRGLRNARNAQEAEAVLVGNVPNWSTYLDTVADDLSRQFSEIVGREFPLTPEMVNDAVPLATREQFNQTFAEYARRIAQGEEPLYAYRNARAKVQQQFASSLPDDLFPPEPQPAPLTQPIGKAQPAFRKPPAPPEAPAAAVEPKPEPPTGPSAPESVVPDTRIEQLQRQENAFVAPPREYDPNVVADFARQLAQEERVPNQLRARFSQEEWAQMSAQQREFALKESLARRADVERGQPFPPGADVYQAGAQAGVAEIPPPRTTTSNTPLTPSIVSDAVRTPDLSDIFKRALDKGIGTATDKGTPNNAHLLNVLNKHKGVDAAPFASLDDVRARADEAMRVLDEYTPTEQVLPKAAQVAVSGSTETSKNIAEKAITKLQEQPTPFTKVFFRLQEQGIPFSKLKKMHSYDEGKRLGGVAASLKAGGEGFGGAPTGEGMEVVVFEGKHLGDLYDGVVAKPVREVARFPEPEWRQLLEDGIAWDFERWDDYIPSSKPNIPPASTGAMSLDAGEPQPLDALATINQQARLQRILERAKENGASSVLDPQINAEWNDALTQSMLDSMEKAIADGQNPVRVLPPEVAQAMQGYLKGQYLPALNEAKVGANATGRFFVDSTVLNYDGRWNVDDGLALAAPFTFWWLHTLANYTRDFIDHPALLAFYVRLRQNLDKQAEGMPDRFKHRVALPMPLSDQLGVGDSIWVEPLRAFMPVGEVYRLTDLEKASYGTVKDDGTTDFNSVFGDLFGIHTPYKLGWALLSGRGDEIQNIVASIPAARLLRGVTQGITPGGIGLTSEYDKFYYERALKELVAEGKLTADEMKIALLQQSGKGWDMARQRAGLENYGVRELSALTGMRGYAFTAGEQKYLDAQKQRDTLTADAVRRLGGNPNMTPEQQYEFLTKKGFYQSPEYQQLKEQHPELDAISFVNNAYGEGGARLPESAAQEERYRAYLIDSIWNAYFNAPELKQKLIVADLGEPFKSMFLDKPEQGGRDYSKIPLTALLGWANAVDAQLVNVAQMEPQTPDPYKVTFTSDAQNAAYQKFYDEVAQSIGWDQVRAWGAYQASLDKETKRAWFESPDGKTYKTYLEYRDAFYKKNPDIAKILEQADLKQPSAGGGSGTTRTPTKPFYLRESYDPRVPFPRQPYQRSPNDRAQKAVNTRSLYALFANLRQKQPQQPQLPSTAYRNPGGLK